MTSRDMTMTDKEPQMKVFIWNRPYPVHYGCAFAFAIAPDVEAARAAIRAGGVSRYGDDPEGTTVAGMTLDIDREPDRILEGPAGEIVEWEE